MRRLKKTLIHLAAVVFVFAAVLTFGTAGSNCATVKAETQKTTESKKTEKTGWFTKGKYTYYRMENGKLCKKFYMEIDGKKYSFDKKGRLRKGLVTLSKVMKAYFDKTDGHFICNVMDMTVTKKYSGSVRAKDADGGLYSISLSKLVNKKDKAISEKKVRKNSKIRVWYTGDIMESWPAQVREMKVTLLKR